MDVRAKNSGRKAREVWEMVGPMPLNETLESIRTLMNAAVIDVHQLA